MILANLNSSLVSVAGTTGLAIANSSPVVSALPVSFIPVSRVSNLSNSRFDIERDFIGLCIG